MKAELSQKINALGALILCAVISGAYVVQFTRHEFPCPLCLLIRLGMLGVIFGALLNVKFGPKPQHYGICLLSALFGGAVATRQILLHIVPGTGSYGSAVWGLHLYSWAWVVFAVVVFGVGFMLIFDRQFDTDAAPSSTPGIYRLLMIIAIVLALGNVVTTLLECGIEACPDNPTEYKWL